MFEDKIAKSAFKIMGLNDDVGHLNRASFISKWGIDRLSIAKKTACVILLPAVASFLAVKLNGELPSEK